MIRLTRLNHVPMVLNSDLIEHLEMTPDTVITLVTGQKIVVLESADEIVERIVRYRQSLGGGGRTVLPFPPADRAAETDDPVNSHGS